jgi:tetratricopeptide (TPR) repeat protein
VLWPLASVFFLLASAGLVGWVVWRKVPQLRMIDVSTIPTERAKRLKEQIILQKFERLGAEKMGTVAKAARHGVTAASKVGRRAVQRLYALEQYYQKLKRAPTDGPHAVDQETIKRLLDEAGDLVRQEEYIPAEKRYIEIISHNPKHVKAYEGLGNLYLWNKQYAQARETLLFTLRLSPDDASVYMSLAEVELAEENPRKALEHLRRCVELRPNNPKFIDRYVETAFSAKRADDAKKGIALLKEANPENQKIGEFEERLAAMSENPSQPTEPLV